MTAGHTQRVGNLLLGQLQLRGKLLGRGGALVLLLEAGESLVDLVERTDLIQRQTHDTRLLGQSLQDRLAGPPHGIRYEFESSRLVELLGRLDKTEIALVDKVGQTQSLILVLLGHRHDEAQVGLGQFLQCLLIALLDALSQFHFLFDGYKLLLADLLQILVERCALTIGDRLSNF